VENEWFVIKDNTNYEINIFGDIRNYRTKKITKPKYDKDGYKRITILLNKKSKNYIVHRLLAIQFIPNPENNSYTIGFIGTKVKQAVPGLARLLTHYGKYSFLGFEGERPNNVLKGEFPALNSPLFYPIPYDGKYLETNATIEPAKALID